MNTRSWLRSSYVVGSFLFASAFASAQTMSCVNDDDCPEPQCGGQVCDWNKGLLCYPAGQDPAGKDGWCSTTEDCKCKGLGAVCVGVYCTFTRPQDAPASGGAAATSGGAAATSGGAAATSGGAASASGGAATAGAAAAGAATAGATSAPPAEDDGGCSIATAGRANVLGSWPLLGAALGVWLARRARRQSRR